MCSLLPGSFKLSCKKEYSLFFHQLEERGSWNFYRSRNKIERKHLVDEHQIYIMFTLDVSNLILPDLHRHHHFHIPPSLVALVWQQQSSNLVDKYAINYIFREKSEFSCASKNGKSMPPNRKRRNQYNQLILWIFYSPRDKVMDETSSTNCHTHAYKEQKCF